MGELADARRAEPKPLTKDEVRQLLRECVTVVKPGEALVVRIANLSPAQCREYQRAVTDWHEAGDLPFRAFIFVGDELGVVDADIPDTGFLP
jgi:predicted SAM-dependent methyltransferase